MRFLLSLFKRSRILLLFLILEGTAFTLILSQRSYQRATLLNSTNRATGEFLKDYNELTRYLNLEVENENLARENARLQNLLDRSKVFQTFGADTIGDSTSQVRFTTIEGRVINGSYYKRNNYLTIDKGAKSGVKIGMGVAGPSGAVGIINGVTNNFASVLPIINPNLTLTGKFKRTGYFGPLKWDGEDYRYAFIEDIPRYAELQTGDTLVTDSRSLIFPEGLMVGIAKEKKLQADQNFYRVQVELSTDFARLEHIYVIKDKLKTELDSLAQIQ